MDLREHTIALRLSTWRDLLDDRTAAQLIDNIEALTERPFSSSQDLGSSRRQHPGRPRDGRIVLHDYLERGLNLCAKIRLFSANPEDPTGQQVLTLRAGGHPYTGRFRTALDLRLPKQLFEAPAFVQAFIELVENWSIQLCPFQAHAHDTDDTNAQNMASPHLLKAGFGIELDEANRDQRPPGLEVSRGELRYHASWLTVLGPEHCDELGIEAIQSFPCSKRQLAPKLWLLQLFHSPLQIDDNARGAQRLFWDHFDIETLVREKGWAMGYWHRSFKPK